MVVGCWVADNLLTGIIAFRRIASGFPGKMCWPKVFEIYFSLAQIVFCESLLRLGRRLLRGFQRLVKRQRRVSICLVSKHCCRLGRGPRILAGLARVTPSLRVVQGDDDPP